jgi:hypothetical protein
MIFNNNNNDDIDDEDNENNNNNNKIVTLKAVSLFINLFLKLIYTNIETFWTALLITQ